MRGRKKTENAKTERYVCRITKEQKEVLKNNPFLTEEINHMIRSYIDAFDTNKEREEISIPYEEPTRYVCMDENGNRFCTDINPNSKKFKERFKDIL